MNTSDQYVFAAKLSELPEESATLVAISGRPILVCKSEGEVFAVENQCSHQSEPLDRGHVRKCTIVCPWHGARFSLKTGAPMGGPAMTSVRTYSTRIIGDNVEVKI